MTVPVFDIRNLSVRFPSRDGGVQALKNVSLALQAGEILGVVGESGSGKSVMSLAVMGLLLPTAELDGEIWFHAYSSSATPAVNLLTLPAPARRRYRGRQMAMIFQEPLTSLNPVYTCGHQVIEALLLHRDLDRQQAMAEAIALFEEVQLPRAANLMERYPHQLSGGQLQRVMIAMALSGNPAMLIADEPTTALDVTIQAAILELIRHLQQKRNMAVVFITHDMGVIAEVADRVVVMYRGQVVETATVYDLFAQPQHPYTQGLLHCRPRPSQRLQRLPTVADFMTISHSANGTLEVAAKPHTPEERAALLQSIPEQVWSDRLQRLYQQQPLLRVSHLVKAFPVRRGLLARRSEMRAVDDVSFEVYPGETLGLVGESGCGKSTLGRCLLRLLEPTSGEIEFAGQSIMSLSDRQMRPLRCQLQIIFQNPYGSLDARQSIGSAVMEPMVIHQLYASDAERYDHAVRLLERVGLDSSAMTRMPHEFSGGQRQRICIARSLACRPSFMICDESVSALDVSVQAQVLNLLKELQQEFGLTYIFISHDLSVVKFVSDRIMVMNRGRIEEIGPADEIYHRPQRDYTRQLIAAIPDPSLGQIRQRQDSQGASPLF